MSLKHPHVAVLVFAALTGCTTELEPDDGALVLDPAAVLDEGVIVGELDWVSSTQLTGTAKTASLATGYVSIPQASARCSGFLIGRDVFMTNHHCIANEAMAFGVTVNFKYDTVWDERGVVRCDEFIGANQALDYALVRCKGNPGDSYGWLTLDEAPLSTADSIQLFHQQCDYNTDESCAPTKKMSPGRITSTTSMQNRITHDADMLGGSSGGAIVATDTTRVVAINNAHILAGTQNGRGTTNIGVPMSLVVPHIRANFPAALTTSAPATPTPSACPAVPSAGRVIDEDDACVTLSGDAQWWRAVAGAGSGDDLVWTGTTNNAVGKNVADYMINVASSGRYELSMWIDATYATATGARYVVRDDDGVTEVVLDQSAVSTSGWVSLGAFNLTAGRTAGVQLADNTGVRGQQLVVDALAVVPVSSSTEPTEPTAVESCSLVAIDGVQALNVRPEPNTDHAPIAVLGVDDVAERTGSVTGQTVNGSTTWYAITTDDGVEGYIAAAYAVCLN